MKEEEKDDDYFFEEAVPETLATRNPMMRYFRYPKYTQNAICRTIPWRLTRDSAVKLAMEDDGGIWSLFRFLTMVRPREEIQKGKDVQFENMAKGIRYGGCKKEIRVYDVGGR